LRELIGSMTLDLSQDQLARLANAGA
jgi:hypothetical protein